MKSTFRLSVYLNFPNFHFSFDSHVPGHPLLRMALSTSIFHTLLLPGTLAPTSQCLLTKPLLRKWLVLWELPQEKVSPCPYLGFCGTNILELKLLKLILGGLVSTKISDMCSSNTVKHRKSLVVNWYRTNLKSISVIGEGIEAGARVI